MNEVPDRIEKRIVLRAPIARVWRAISDSREFGLWFGVRFDAPFVPGTAMKGRMTPTTVDPEVAAMQKPHEGKSFDCTIEAMEEPRRFSFRWHPFAIEPGTDYSAEPATLVVFELREVPGGTELTISESGFSRIPLARRAAAFTANDGGWGKQTTLLDKYLRNVT